MTNMTTDDENVVSRIPDAGDPNVKTPRSPQTGEPNAMRTNDTETAVLYGCECDCANHRSGPSQAPVAFLVDRHGQHLKVCTRCDLSSDTKLGRYFDEASPFEVFFDFDPLGGVCIASEKFNALPFLGATTSVTTDPTPDPERGVRSGVEPSRGYFGQLFEMTNDDDERDLARRVNVDPVNFETPRR